MSDSTVGLNTTYDALRASSIFTTVAQEKVFCGPADDPFFADLGGIFDVGNFRPQGNSVNPPKDALARFNVHSIALQVPISLLQKNGENVSQAANILDPNFIIGLYGAKCQPSNHQNI